ncbi:MAG: hypothetical protein ACXWKQ_07365 [Reyranella sp.]
MPYARPTLGHPTKDAAIIAMVKEGKRPSEIARELGDPPKQVSAKIWKARQRGLLPPAAGTGRARSKFAPGAAPQAPKKPVWTAEKRTKARRLFGRTMIYIAEAIDVPAEEFLKYVLHGVIPPSHTLVDADAIDWRDEPPAEVQPQLAPPAPEPEPEPGATEVPAEDFVDVTPAPSRDDDEAELARLEAEEEETTAEEPVATPPEANLPAVTGEEPPAPTFRLENPSGAWLHRNLGKFTYKLGEAWVGTGADIERVGKMNRRYLELEPMRAS